MTYNNSPLWDGHKGCCCGLAGQKGPSSAAESLERRLTHLPQGQCLATASKKGAMRDCACGRHHLQGTGGDSTARDLGGHHGCDCALVRGLTGHAVLPFSAGAC